MSDGTRDEGENGGRSAEEAALSARLQSLGDRLNQRKAAEQQAAEQAGFLFPLSLGAEGSCTIGGNLSTAPALMGNAVVWKPSEKSALANYIFYQALQKAGLPAGVINFVPADAAALTKVALASPELAGVHYTGSTAVFRSIWAGVGANMSNYRTFPRLVGETGGKGYVLAHPSADVEVLAIALVRAAFEFQGQKCSAASRAYIPKSLWPAVAKHIKERLAELQVGDVADPKTFMGAVIDQKSEGVRKMLAAFTVDPSVVLLGRETIYRDGERVGWLTSGGFGYTIDRSIGYGYVRNPQGVTRNWVLSGTYELEVAGRRTPAEVSMQPLYDPTNARVKA